MVDNRCDRDESRVPPWYLANGKLVSPSEPPMHHHDHDENSAPNQTREKMPADPAAHLAQGVSGAQPPLEEQGAEKGRRHKTAAGFASIYETAHYG